ncbi:MULTISPECIES: hypothetical protein [Staphylococcus]|jgi:hypothetical protein|uniref:hypothetical protein n=1 Tax=Staphylococcus TaxID=1279 RepID=UPI001642676E|nr:hypothetical protein [Staphylococcus saprophyticus]MBC2921948.1 hypothetical protein [Staphylococcus saprophyticus]MBC2958529.1 hypothetical protein [Staphylococcus saprophyticus]MBC3010388.1 hypothetical protein [Staphylococcus saprophyticus]MBC3024267.1 hypothetical protein [Staphylococcus saprophyticus]MBC3031494.1 hypothetical protein [Staphylococcus saprophyticus]
MNREEIEKHLKEVEPLDKFLTNRGVEISDLHAAMNDKVDYVPEFDYYYDSKEKQTQLAWIDTNYIHAPARSGNNGHSWYNLLFWGVYGLPQNKDANLSTVRFYDLLTNLTKMNFKELKALYEDGNSGLSLYDFNKYIKTGESPIYIGVNDGTHRIILAKVLGVNYVTSKKVYVYEYNAEKHRIYEDLKIIIEKLESFLQTSNTFNLSEDGEYIKINTPIYTYMGVIFEDINPFTFNKNASEYIEHIAILNKYYSILKEIEIDYNKQINIYKYIPKGILNFMGLAHKDIYLEEIEDNKKLLLKKVKILKALDSK